MGGESPGGAQPTLRHDWIGSRPAIVGIEWPACMSTDDFDCSTCEHVEPNRCDFRQDYSFLSERRRRLTFHARRPRPGLETAVYDELLRRRSSVYYRDVARDLSAARGYTDPVSVLDVLQAGTLFLDLGNGYYRAISRTLDFEEPTDNLWYRPPPFEEETKDATFTEARRLGAWLFTRELGPDPTMADALRTAGDWRRYPSERELAAARESVGEDRVRRAGVDLVAQLARRSPVPDLGERLPEAIERMGVAARRRMIESNLRLVWVIARGFAGRGLDYVDLCQEGTLGLMTAVEKFNPELGFAFSTYATHWVRQAMQRAVADRGRLIRVPVHLYERRPFLHKEHLGYRIPVAERPTLRPMFSLTSLPESLHPAVDWQEAAEATFIADRVRAALGSLTERERRIVSLRFGLDDGRPRTLEEIGQGFSLTRERIRQIEAKALKKLRHPARRLRRLLDRRPRPRPEEPSLPPAVNVAALSKFEARVIGLRFGLYGDEPRSLRGCGTELDIPAGRVALIEDQALRRLGRDAANELRRWRWARLDVSPKLPARPRSNEEGRSLREAAPGRSDPDASRESRGSAAETSSAESEASSGPLSPEELLDETRRGLGALTNSERLVLTQRLGLDNGAPLTVDEVVYLYRYGRERVLNIERSAVMKLDPAIIRAVAARLGIDLGSPP